MSNKCNAEPAGSKSVPVLQLEKIRLSNKPKTLFFLSRVQQLLKGTIFPPGTPLSLGKLSATKIQIQTGIFPFGGGWVETLARVVWYTLSKFNGFFLVFLGGGGACVPKILRSEELAQIG